ncbi:transcription repressor OFP8 [Lactuca sativa]|uniref:transcription repressor OFP8 n=1 Tax=Lactuca sativa TaxID=4236 RepID=UPI000CC9AF69|nr:transcription repressor OFP8 [Lactuca sativa]
MENRLKLKISKMFQTCRSKHTSDVSDQPFFFPENQHHRQLIDLFSPKPKSFCKTKCHVDDEPKTNLFHPKITDQIASFPAYADCRKPAKKKPHYRKPKKVEDFSSTTDNYYYGWRSSDEEDESDDETVLFSSRSFSSDSSGSFRKYRAQRKSKKKSKRTCGDGDGNSCGCKSQRISDETPLEKSGKLVKDSFAVVKKSSNPHEDFRVSMVEMIVEKQIFGAEDLEDLLECFISLNSEEHHRVIFEVFTEIWDTLFSASV